MNTQSSISNKLKTLTETGDIRVEMGPGKRKIQKSNNSLM